jgi:hypothetical protein
MDSERVFHREALRDVRPFVVFGLLRIVLEYRINLEPHFGISLVFVHDRLQVPDIPESDRGREVIQDCPEFRPGEKCLQQAPEKHI